MTIRQVYQYLLEFLKTHPKWIHLWFLNKVRNKDVTEKVYNPATGDVPNQDWGPFKPIPNIRGIEVHLGAMNELMLAFGIETKFKPSFAYKAYVNAGMNKYFNYQIYRLRKLAVTDPKEYFKLAFRLMKKSKVMFVIGLNHVEPKWHRDFKLWYIKRIYREYVEISMSGKWKAVYKRTYIPKGEKVRPLGVPDLSWRIHNHQLGNIISMYLECKGYFNSPEGKHKEQCGFRTGLGCKTAWERILKTVEKSDWVYEFDLSRCFSNIHIKAVSKALRKAGTPQGLISKLELLNLSPVKNPWMLRMDTKETNEWNKWINTNPGWENIEKAQQARNGGVKVLNDRWTWWEQKTATEGIQIDNTGATCKIEKLEPINRSMVATKWALEMEDIKQTPYLNVLDSPSWKSEHKAYYDGKPEDYKRGLPQGLPTSPILTISALQECFMKKSKWNTLMYADDGLIYGNGPAPSEEEIILAISNNKYGISVNREKSGFAKLPGQEMNLKFLGMRLKGDTLTAETRNGSVLTYDKHDLVAVYDLLENWHCTYEAGYSKDGEYSADGRTPLQSEEVLYQKDYVQEVFRWDRRTSRSAFEKLASSRLFGLILSRMYSGNWNQDIFQCFDLKYITRSWSDLYLTTKLKLKSPLGESLNVFNSTSIACHSLLNVLASQKAIKRHYRKSKEVNPKEEPVKQETSKEAPQASSADPMKDYNEYMESLMSHVKEHNSTKLMYVLNGGKGFFGLTDDKTA